MTHSLYSERSTINIIKFHARCKIIAYCHWVICQFIFYFVFVYETREKLKSHKTESSIFKLCRLKQFTEMQRPAEQ